MGLVFTYKVSRVVNFAYGVVAMFCAYSYWQFRVMWHWAVALALVAAVIVVPVALALLSERLVYRRLAHGSVFARTAASSGILLAVYGVSSYIWNTPITQGTLNPPSLFPSSVVLRLPGVAVTGIQVGIVVSVGVVVALTFVLLRFTRRGVELRAVVVNRDLAELRGISANMVSRLAWSLSYILAGVTGVLIAPLIGGDPTQLTLIVVYSLAAAVLGGLLSLPLALAGGLGLGLISSLLLGYEPGGSVTAWISGVVPFAFLFIALIAQARKLSTGEAGEKRTAMLDDLASAATDRRPAARSMLVIAGLVLVVGVILRATNSSYLVVVSGGLAIGIIYLSIRAFTAITGMVSFAQVAFAGVGAFTAADLITSDNVPWGVAVLLAGVIAGVGGGIMALPTVRLRGVFLTLATLAFAQLIDTGLFSSLSFTGGSSGVPLPLPSLLQGTFAYFIFLLLAFLVIGYSCELFQHSGRGKELKADLGASAGARSIGIRSQRGRLLAFMLSAAVAGIGGALFSGIDQVVTTSNFQLVPTAFLYLATVAIAGIGSTALVLELAVLSAVVTQLFAVSFPNETEGFVAIFGVVSLLVLRVPGGSLAIQTSQQKALVRGIQRLRLRGWRRGLGGDRSAGAGRSVRPAAARPLPPADMRPVSVRDEAGDGS